MKNLKLEIIQTTENYQLLNIVTIGNGVLKVDTLSELTLPDEDDKSKGVVIYGRGPIWLYSYLVHECHSFAWVAVFDPRLGGVVVQSHVANSLSIGDIVPIENIVRYIKKNELEKRNNVLVDNSRKAIAVVGPPHSGKSVLLQKLKTIIFDNTAYSDECFIFRACPDGEGNWSGEVTVEIRNSIREKKVFDNDFPEISARQILEIRKSKKLVMVDCGGKIDKKNQIIMNACNSAIIISSKPEEIPEWIGACKSAELDILATIYSTLEHSAECISDNPLKFRMGIFDRNNINDLVLPEKLIQLFHRVLK